LATETRSINEDAHVQRIDLKKVSFALLPTLALVVVVAAVAEIALRFRNESTSAITGVTSWKTAQWKDLVYHWDTYHPLLGWTNLPGYRSGPEVPFEIAINSQGLRALREYPPRPTHDRRRLLIFGDSSVFGEEVDDDQTLPFHLEQEILGAEVLNFGVHGYGLGQMALRLEEEGFALHPDHVVVVYLTYDFMRDPQPRYLHAKPVFRVEGGQLVVENTPVPESAHMPWFTRHSFAAAWIWGRMHRLKPMERGSLDAGLEITSAILARIRAACEARDVPLTLVHVVDGPTIAGLRSNPLERRRVKRIREVLAASEFDLLDLAPYLEERLAATGPSLLAPHGHWSGLGNRLIAARIAEHLDWPIDATARGVSSQSAPLDDQNRSE
jgi:hypothetical protein